MSKRSFNFGDRYELYDYTNPVTHTHKIRFRVRHDIVRSRRLKAYDRCMHNQLEGKTYRGHGAREDEILVHQHFAQAAHYCATYDKQFPSDKRH